MSDYDPYGDARKPTPEETEQKAKKADRGTTQTREKKAPAPSRADQAKVAVHKGRTMVAQAVWAVAVFAAVVLAGAALCIALKANPDNNLVDFLTRTADKLDFGVFELGANGIYHATGDTQEALTKNAVVNYGVAAVVWLILGGIVAKIIRPKAAVPGRKS